MTKKAKNSLLVQCPPGNAKAIWLIQQKTAEVIKLVEGLRSPGNDKEARLREYTANMYKRAGNWAVKIAAGQ